MKKFLTIALCLFTGINMIAQSNGYLIVKVYDPDEWQCHTNNAVHYVDMNDDGNYDFTYSAYKDIIDMIHPEFWAANGCCFHTTIGDYYYFDNIFYDFDTPFNDTALTWSNSVYGTRFFPEDSQYDFYDTLVYRSGIRNGEEGEYYYGWVEAYAIIKGNEHSVCDTACFHLARTCYCTIPNYPLHWGQTSFEWDGLEDTPTIIANIHPNPTNGQVIITGKDLRQAEVFNTLGQNVATVHGEGERITLDISALPAGIYFVNVTDEDGKKCVKKVIKK